MKLFPIKPAGWFWGTLLRKLGFAGIAMPWAIYILPKYIDDERLRVHELARRDGTLIWFLKAGYYLCHYGYWASPYEVEARAAAADYRSNYQPIQRARWPDAH
jgi:hypothetical protein